MRINQIFNPGSLESTDIFPDQFVLERLSVLQNGFRHRNVQIGRTFERTRPLNIPEDILTKIVDGLIKNAIENTPDGGRIDLAIEEKGTDVLFRVKDYGVGISEENQARIFEGFYPTQDMTRYSTRKPFDFNAGGKGADLLRMKIFSETYHFTITMQSTRCPVLQDKQADCPGFVGACKALGGSVRCENMGGTEFVLRFSKKQ
jgi:hypothetical protein